MVWLKNSFRPLTRFLIINNCDVITEDGVYISFRPLTRFLIINNGYEEEREDLSCFRPLTRFLIINFLYIPFIALFIILFPSPYEVPNYKL